MGAAALQVVIVGGCAAQAIKRGLSSSADASARYQFAELPVHLVDLNDKTSLELISRASHIFAQLGGGTDLALIEAHAPSGCRIFTYPDVVLRSLWPFDSDYGYADEVAQARTAPAIRHFDGALARLRKIEPDKKKRIQRYRDLDFPWAGYVRIVAIAQQRFLEKTDTLSACKMGGFVSRALRERQLFYNATHPSAAYFQELCTYCWGCLELPGAPGALKGIDSWRDWSVPVHPGIARHLGVRWASESTRYYYRTMGEMTWDAWVEQYVEMFG
jgi:hypothetical protein